MFLPYQVYSCKSKQEKKTQKKMVHQGRTAVIPCRQKESPRTGPIRGVSVFEIR